MAELAALCAESRAALHAYLWPKFATSEEGQAALERTWAATAAMHAEYERLGIPRWRRACDADAPVRPAPTRPEGPVTASMIADLRVLYIMARHEDGERAERHAVYSKAFADASPLVREEWLRDHDGRARVLARDRQFPPSVRP